MSKLKRAVPELRFLKHDGSSFPEWEYVPLRLIATMVIKKNKDKKVSRVLTNSASDGIVDQRDYFNKDIAVKDNLDGYYVVNYGDYVYNPRISSLAPVGPISKNKIGLGVMSPLYIVFRFNNKNNDFYEHFFNFSSWYAYLQRIANMGARHDRISIKNSDFMEMPVPKLDDTEQKKISDFLSSIDDLIIANSNKLESLNFYKKGLMQKLFPSEGKYIPELRFSGFNEGWVVKKVQSICYLQAGKFVKSENIKRKRSDRLYPCYGGNGLRGFTESFTHEGAYSLIGRQGALCGNVNFVDGTFHATEHAVVAEPKENVDNLWLYYELCRLNLNRFSTGQAQPGLSVENLNQVDTCIPKFKKEQQKIAECLSTLDDLIKKQSMKVEYLKTHKKGLMQRLFPFMEGIDA